MIKSIFGSGNDFGVLRPQSVNAESLSINNKDSVQPNAVNAPSFGISVGGEDFLVTDQTYVKNIREFLSIDSSNNERLDAVAAVLSKNIEPTRENLEMAYNALYGDTVTDAAVLNNVPVRSAKADGDELRVRGINVAAEQADVNIELAKNISSNLRFEAFKWDLPAVTVLGDPGGVSIYADSDIADSYVLNDREPGDSELSGRELSGLEVGTPRGDITLVANSDIKNAASDIEAVDAVFDFAEDTSEVRSDDSVSATEGNSEGIKEEELSGIVEAAIAGLLEGLEGVVGSFDFRTYLVTEQTEITMRAAREFKAMQATVLQTLKKNDPGVIKSAIDTLSSAINKSVFAMMTDMKTEKTLLLSIAKLEDAAAALKNREYASADRIVKAVSRELEALDFRPSVRKIRLMAQQKLESDIGLQPGRPVQRVSSAISLFSSGTARDMLELARFTGINHEIEKYESSSIAGGLKNLKEIFGDGSFSASLCGQQMLNDSDGRPRSFYVVEVPMEIDGEIGGLKVIVNGKCDENVIDWRNTDLYFTLRLADKEKLGVRFSINSANVKIEVYSDRQMDWSDIGDELGSIGYNLVSVKQSALAQKTAVFVGERLQREAKSPERGDVRDESGFEAKI